MFGSDSEDEDSKTSKSKKTKKGDQSVKQARGSKAWIQEGAEDEPVDFLDTKVVQRIVGMRCPVLGGSRMVIPVLCLICFVSSTLLCKRSLGMSTLYSRNVSLCMDVVLVLRELLISMFCAQLHCKNADGGTLVQTFSLDFRFT